ncbi:MAG TPA: deoxyribose-phosphate aldolase [Anaerolineales bacterium]|nr:deoxyribose-phosphate aldolase [Anaerolineales bacterium]
MYAPPATPTVDQIQVEARAAGFTTRSIKNESKRAALALITRMIDLTTLEGMDTPGKVQQLCQKAVRPATHLAGVPSVAAVCVYPPMVRVARQVLGSAPVNVAAVATYFPSGQAELSMRLQEVRDTVAAGADEIDMVISRGEFLRGNYNFTFDEVAATKSACGSAHLKVILETGELGTYDQVRKASQIAIDAGADFIKTSTGKVQPAATMPVTLVMLETIRDHYLKTGKMVGMKPAGGIRTAKQAWHYLVMVKETLGDAWLSPDWFRFGASALLNDVLMQWAKLDSGNYQSGDDFSND